MKKQKISSSEVARMIEIELQRMTGDIFIVTEVEKWHFFGTRDVVYHCTAFTEKYGETWLYALEGYISGNQIVIDNFEEE